MVEPENAAMSEPRVTIPVKVAKISNLIYTVRGMQVMLDSDLAMLYGVETKVLNQAVSRNPERFPERFCFRLTKEEAEIVRSQIVTLQPELGKQGSWWRYLPRAFSEMGVSMLSAVLRSKTAIDASIRIMDSFVEMRRFVAENAVLLDRIRGVELRQLEYQRTTDERLERVFDYMEAHGKAGVPDQKIFFDGQVYDALELLSLLVRRAEREIVLIDNYVNDATLSILAKKSEGIAVTIWTRPSTLLEQHDAEAFNEQYPTLEVRYTEDFHDRFLIIDDIECYHVGASLKDAGRKCFAITRIQDPSAAGNILSYLGNAADLSNGQSLI